MENMENEISYAERVLELIEARGMTIYDFCTKSGISESTMRRKIQQNADGLPTGETLKRMAETLDTSIDYLVYGERKMTLNEYQGFAQRTSNCISGGAKIQNGCLGLAGEVGEVCDILKKYLYQGHPFDRRHMIEELGDVQWYVAELAAGLGITLSQLASSNIKKLRERYPEGFQKERSLNRNENGTAGEDQPEK